MASDLMSQGSSQLDEFMKAMDGEWIVISHEIAGDLIRVTYRSIDLPHLTWSHIPFSFSMVPKVGIVGRLGFHWTRQ